MQIDVKYVFFLPKKKRSKPVLAIWTEGWAEEEIKRIRAMKVEIKAMAAAVGAKIYMTPIHPHEQELREDFRREQRGPRYRQRMSERREATKEAAARGEEPVADIVVDPVTGSQLRSPGSHAELRHQFNNSKRHHRKFLEKAKGKVCAECGQTDGLTVDHIKSLANGGDNDRSNMQLLCDPCHVVKTIKDNTITQKSKDSLGKQF
jgi:5-methylcytosine-specific restriction endonuclease McrA